MDDLTDASDGEVPPPPLEPIQIVEFPNFEGLHLVIPLPEDEIQVVDLLGFLNLGD